MKKFIVFTLSMIVSSLSFAETYRGTYQFKDAQGRILYQDVVQLDIKSISASSLEYTYTENTKKGLVKSVCIVEVKKLSNHTSSLVEKCPDYTDSSVCQNELCTGTSEWMTPEGSFPRASVEGKEVKRLVINTLEPVTYLGIKDIRSFNQVLTLVQPSK